MTKQEQDEMVAVASEAISNLLLHRTFLGHQLSRASLVGISEDTMKTIEDNYFNMIKPLPIEVLISKVEVLLKLKIVVDDDIIATAFNTDVASAKAALDAIRERHDVELMTRLSNTEQKDGEPG